VALCAAVLVASCSSDDGGGADTADAAEDEAAAGEGHARPQLELPAGYERYSSEVYADDAHWLCKPGIENDVCSRDLDATAVAADGTIDVIEHETAEDPPVDCFYVYPTTSADPGPNSDFDPGEPAEIATVYNQVARLSSTCRVYAPCTASSPSRSSPEVPRRPKESTRAVAYGDVLDAVQGLHRQRERRSRLRPGRPLAGRRHAHPADRGRDRRRAAAARPARGGLPAGIDGARARG
jgi:hypothetical protein